MLLCLQDKLPTSTDADVDPVGDKITSFIAAKWWNCVGGSRHRLNFSQFSVHRSANNNVAVASFFLRQNARDVSHIASGTSIADGQRPLILSVCVLLLE